MYFLFYDFQLYIHLCLHYTTKWHHILVAHVHLLFHVGLKTRLLIKTLRKSCLKLDRQLMTAERRIKLSKGWSPALIIQRKVLNPEAVDTQTTNMDSEGCIYTYVCVRVCVTAVTGEEEANVLRVRQGHGRNRSEDLGKAGGREEKSDVIIL